MLLKKKHEQITKLRPNNPSRQILEQQLEAFRAKFGRDPGPNDPVFFDSTADEPRPLNTNSLKQRLLEGARQAGLPQPVIRYIEESFDRDAAFDCPQCEAQVIAWALSHPACPDCGHHPLTIGKIVAE
jgi:hypothetical protein